MAGKKKDPAEDTWRSIRANPNGGYDVDTGSRVENRREMTDPGSWTSVKMKDSQGYKTDPEDAIRKAGRR